MFKFIRFLQNSLIRHRIVWRAVGALSLGALLGALAAAPYDRAFGLSALPYTSQLYTALQSLAATATLVRVRTTDRMELGIEIGTLPDADTLVDIALPQ
jgi:hypothetical protein